MLLSSVGWRALKATLTGMLSPLPREHVVETCTRLPRGGKARHRALRNMPSTNLSDRRRIVVFAILLPASVAASDQLLFEQLHTSNALRSWLYPWMVFTTGALSWCT